MKDPPGWGTFEGRVKKLLRAIKNEVEKAVAGEVGVFAKGMIYTNAVFEE